MAFSLFGKRKKYPFNKQKKNPAAAVYAGPEYFARRAGRIYAGPEPSRGNEGEVLDVYAGPEFDGEPTSPADERFDAVYAGPEPPEEPSPVYAGPEKPERAALVYAGPEFFAGKRSGLPEEDPSLAVGVYAGPEPSRSSGMGMMLGMMGVPSPVDPAKAEDKGDGEA
jgi:hypothetical protein